MWMFVVETNYTFDICWYEVLWIKRMICTHHVSCALLSDVGDTANTHHHTPHGFLLGFSHSVVFISLFTFNPVWCSRSLFIKRLPPWWTNPQNPMWFPPGPGFKRGFQFPLYLSSVIYYTQEGAERKFGLLVFTHTTSQLPYTHTHTSPIQRSANDLVVEEEYIHYTITVISIYSHA